MKKLIWLQINVEYETMKTTARIYIYTIDVDSV